MLNIFSFSLSFYFYSYGAIVVGNFAVFGCHFERGDNGPQIRHILQSLSLSLGGWGPRLFQLTSFLRLFPLVLELEVAIYISYSYMP